MATDREAAEWMNQSLDCDLRWEGWISDEEILGRISDDERESRRRRYAHRHGGDIAADQAALLASAEAVDAEHAWVLDQADAEEERCVAILLRQTEETRTLGFGEVLLSPSCAEEEERALALALAASRTDYGPGPDGPGSGGASGSPGAAGSGSRGGVSLLQRSAARRNTRCAATGVLR